LAGELGKALELSHKLKKTVGDLVAAGLISGKPQGICLNTNCEFTVQLPERTETRYCPLCKTATVQDVLTLCVLPEGASGTSYGEPPKKKNKWRSR
jgi:hypothetical protein